MLFEGMTPEVANTIFSKFGVKNAAEMEKEVLKKYYIALVKKHHPDVGGSNNEMRYINAAYDILSQYPKAETLDAKYWNDLWRWRQGDGPPPNRTYPKGKNKSRLDKVKVQFRFDDETIITSGKSDYFDLIKIFQHLNDFGVRVMFDPTNPYDNKSGEWITDSVLIYVSSDIRSRKYMINVIHGFCETYF
jgi:curved DNA-binding protein CbpA